MNNRNIFIPITNFFLAVINIAVIIPLGKPTNPGDYRIIEPSELIGDHYHFKQCVHVCMRNYL